MCIGVGRGQSEDTMIDIMRMLIEGGSDACEVDCDGRSLLHEVVISETMYNTKIIRFLVEMGVPDSVDSQGMSAGELARADIWDSLIGPKFSQLIDALFYTSCKRQKIL